MRRLALFLALSFAVSACQTSRAPVARAPAPTAPVAEAPRAPAVDRRAALNGRWNASNPNFYSQFRNGIFVTKDASSGTDVARGSYRVNGDRVAISFESASNRGVTQNASCSLRGGTTLACTGDRGPFTLQRA